MKASIKYPVLIVILSLVILSGLLSIIAFRHIPKNKLWEDYTVMYASVSVPEKEVLTVLEQSACKDVVSLSLQSDVLDDNFFANTMAPVRFISDSSISNDFRGIEKKYIYPSLKKMYFFDEQKEYQLYYIPDEYIENIDIALGILQEKYPGACGIDSYSSFPVFVPVVCILLFGFFLFCSDNKLVFSILSIFPLIFILLVPNSVNGSAICICLYGLFLIQRLWKRNKAIRYGVHNVYIAISLIAPFFLCLASSFRNSILYIIALICSASVLYLYSILETRSRSFVPILSASFVPVLTKTAADYLFVCAAAILVQLVASFIPSQQSSSKFASKNMMLPSPVVSKNADQEILPDLQSYFKWIWNIKTFPFKNLDVNENLKPYVDVKYGDSIVVPRYQETGTAFKLSIKEDMTPLFVFDESFFNSVLEDIDKLPSSAFEKVLKLQKSGVVYMYTYRTSSEAFSSFSLIIVLCSVCIPLGMAVHYIIGRRKQYAHSI